jgi:hypothetical protein
LLKDKLVLLCVIFIGVLVFVSIFPDQIAPLDYDETSFPDKLAPPGSVATAEKLEGHRYLLGSDRLGRDILSRLIYGTRISIAVAFIGAGVSFLIGVSYGLFSGYSSPKIDNLMMRLVDVVYGYPTLILVILLQVFLTAIARQETSQTTGFQRFIIGLDNSTGGLFFVFVAVGAVSWLQPGATDAGTSYALSERGVRAGCQRRRGPSRAHHAAASAAQCAWPGHCGRDTGHPHLYLHRSLFELHWPGCPTAHTQLGGDDQQWVWCHALSAPPDLSSRAGAVPHYVGLQFPRGCRSGCHGSAHSP